MEEMVFGKSSPIKHEDNRFKQKVFKPQPGGYEQPKAFLHRQPFSSSMKYKKFERDSQIMSNKEIDRKKSVQSYNVVEKTQFDGYIEVRDRSYNSPHRGILKRETQSNSSSRAKLIP